MCTGVRNTLSIQQILIAFFFYTLIFSAITEFDSYDFFSALIHLGHLFNDFAKHCVVGLRYVNKHSSTRHWACALGHIHLILSDLWGSSNGNRSLGMGKHLLLMSPVLMCPRICDLCVIMGNATQDTWPPPISVLPLHKTLPHLYLWQLAASEIIFS